MSSNDAYEVFCSALGFSGSERLHKILEYLLTQQQADIVAVLPGTAADVSAKIDVPEATAQEELDALFFKGAVFPRGDFVTREYFRFARYILQLHDATTASQQVDIVKDRKYFEMWHEFCLEEMYPFLAKGYAMTAQPGSRIVPAYQALEGLPDIPAHDDFREILKAQEKIAVVPCACRHRTEAVGEPCEHTREEETWKCLQLGRAADYVLTRGSGKKLTTDEALDLLDDIEKDGLLHVWPNSTQMTGIHSSCHCCRDCCIFYVPVDMAGGDIGSIWAKSCYEAVVDQEKCDGCQDCVERCQFDAIEMVKPEPTQKGKKTKKSKKLKAAIISDKCWGCGVCVITCEETKALGFKQVRPFDHVPAAP